MSSPKEHPHKESETKVSPMADDKTIKAQGYTAERRRAVPTVRMVKDKNEMDVSALDVEAHARMGWKMASGGR